MNICIKIAIVICIAFIVGSGIAFFAAVSEEQVNAITEIQEEEMEMIGGYKCGFIKIDKLHDNRNNVTCWLYRGGHGGGMSCIPDHMLTP